MGSMVGISEVLGHGEVNKQCHHEVISIQAQQETLNLAVQPLEVLHQILSYVDVFDLPHLSLSCRHLHNFIARDDLLYKTHYLSNFDAPSQTPLSWQEALKELMRIRKLLKSNDSESKDAQLHHVATTAIDMLTATKDPIPNQNRAFLSSLMTSRSNQSAFLSRSSLFRRAGMPHDLPADTEELCQLSAKLHVFYGLEVELSEIELAATISHGGRMVHPCARSRVYDLRRYKRSNHWGPFMDDGSGRVDWEKAQAIMVVLIRGLRIFNERTNGALRVGGYVPFDGLAANSFTSSPSRGCVFDNRGSKDAVEDDFAGKDPYGVQGTWMRVVNFLDYHDLFAFNSQPPFVPLNQERPPITTTEAIRLILLRLQVTRIEAAGEHDDPENDPTMPVVYFEGNSRSITNQFDINGNSKIRGFVRTTKHGDIRWTTFSVFSGEERWRSESVQIGGIRSARGTLGNWFDKDYAVHGPAGPTAFWKLSDDLHGTERAAADEDDEEDVDDEEDDDSWVDDDTADVGDLESTEDHDRNGSVVLILEGMDGGDNNNE